MVALDTQRYRQDPDCRRYEARLSQIHERARAESHATHGLTYWREALAEVHAREEHSTREAVADLAAALAARGLRMVETYDQQAGYTLDLRPLGTLSPADALAAALRSHEEHWSWFLNPAQ